MGKGDKIARCSPRFTFLFSAHKLDHIFSVILVACFGNMAETRQWNMGIDNLCYFQVKEIRLFEGIFYQMIYLFKFSLSLGWMKMMTRLWDW